MDGRRPAAVAQARRRGTESGLQANSPALSLGLHIQLVGAASIRSAAYFEVRTKRVWWAPWRKRKVWTQVSGWHMGGPPAGATVMTVDDVATGTSPHHRPRQRDGSRRILESRRRP